MRYAIRQLTAVVILITVMVLIINLLHWHYASTPLVYQPYCDSGYGFYAPCDIVDAAWNRKWGI